MKEGVASRADKTAFHALRRVKATRALSKAQTAFVLLCHKGDVRELWARSALKVGWLLLKCSTVSKEFNGVETKRGIPHILNIVLMQSYDIKIFLATKISSLTLQVAAS